MYFSLIDKAARVAAIAHRTQKRKQVDEPYIFHPVAVALELSRHRFSDEVIAAALVHDVLEDTDYSEEDLRKEMGESVMRIVDAVTNDDSLPWEEKKLKYIETVKEGSEGAKAVATVDKIHNMKDLLSSLEEQGEAVWGHFSRGKEKKLWFEESMLAMLKESWRHPLVDEYERLVAELKQKLI